MNVTLNVAERLTTFGLLPEQGSFLTLKQIRQAREDLAFSDEESEALSIKNLPNGNIMWNGDADKEKDMEFSDSVAKMIKEALQKLDKEEKLEAKHMSLYEKFVLKGEEKE